MGMINNWKYLRVIAYNGTLTYPRRIDKMQINGGPTYLTQQFINLDTFNESVFEAGDVNEDKLTYDFRVDRAHHIKIRLVNVNCVSHCDFELKFIDTNNTIRIGYTHSTNNFYLDRSESKQVNRYYNNVHKYKMKYEKILNPRNFDIDIILDVNTIELLADQGLVAITALHLNDKIFKKLTLTTKKNFNIKQFTISHSH